MMKSVLISIQPKWCELIASGKKTIEVRKTKPKLETPFKCYIYMTKGEWYKDNKNRRHNGIGKVIGEFVCDKVAMSFVGYNEKGCPSYWDILNGSCLTPNELVCYGEWKTLYGWHISNLVIYDKPKELSEFYRKCDTIGCDDCEHFDYEIINDDEFEFEYEYFCKTSGCIPITRPPRSWCYVESEESEQ